MDEMAPVVEGGAICSPENAELMIEMLRGVVNDGTAAGLRTKYQITADIAGKTGTTQNYTDGWFIGFTPGLVTGVWVGGGFAESTLSEYAIWSGSLHCNAYVVRFHEKRLSG